MLSVNKTLKAMPPAHHNANRSTWLGSSDTIIPAGQHGKVLANPEKFGRKYHQPSEQIHAMPYKSGQGIATGVALGVAFGVVIGELAIGLVVGVALGAAADAHFSKKEEEVSSDEES